MKMRTIEGREESGL